MYKQGWFLSTWITMAVILCTGILSSSANAEPSFDVELANSQGLQIIGADLVHNAGYLGTGVKIGIIDSGIDYTHPELSASYAGGWDFVNNDNDPLDDNGHGTEVAGIIGAARNGEGLVGVAPEASLYAYKVFNYAGSGSYDNVIAALDRAIADGMDVVDLSLGSTGDPGQPLIDACNRAVAAGIILVTSAGNGGGAGGPADTILYPARYDSTIAVGSTDMADNHASFSSVGPELDLVAPGVDIYTTTLFGGYTIQNGTSFSAPYVAGAAALLISEGVTDVRDTLLSTALDLGPAGFDTLYGYGRVNLTAPAIPAPSALILAVIGVPLAIRAKKERARNWPSLIRRR